MEKAEPAPIPDRTVHLYEEVLSALAGAFGPFYLTGGAALSGFYLHHREVRDLDLFTNLHPDFERESRRIQAIVEAHFDTDPTRCVRYSDFLRMVIRGEPEMKIELINDMAAPWGTPLMAGPIPVDNLGNLLASKVNCFLERNRPDDLNDLVIIALNFSFDWEEVLAQARRKLIESQTVLLRSVIRKLSRFREQWGDGASKNIALLPGLASGAGFDWVVVKGSVEMQQRQDNDHITLQAFEQALVRWTDRLSALAGGNDPELLVHPPAIAEAVSLFWGGLHVTIRRKPLITPEEILQRFESTCLHHDKTGQPLPGPDQNSTSRPLARRIKLEMHHAGINTPGWGKIPLSEAVPVGRPLSRRDQSLQNS